MGFPGTILDSIGFYIDLGLLSFVAFRLISMCLSGARPVRRFSNNQETMVEQKCTTNLIA